MLTHKVFQRPFEDFVEKLIAIKDGGDKQAYDISWKVLSAMYHGGLPHRRRRLYLVGILRSKQVSAFKFPRELKHVAPWGGLLDSPGCDPLSLPSDKAQRVAAGIQLIIEKGGNPTAEMWFVDSLAEHCPAPVEVHKHICPGLNKRNAADGVYATTLGRCLNPNEMLRLQGIDPKDVHIPELPRERFAFQKMIGKAAVVPVLRRVITQMVQAIDPIKRPREQARWC